MKNLEKQYETNAKIQFDQKKFQDCLKTCFTCMSINPCLQWIYELSGYCYFNIGMWSQSKGCFETAKSLEKEDNKKINYNRIIELCEKNDKNIIN
jgi:hypothetical protein